MKRILFVLGLLLTLSHGLRAQFIVHYNDATADTLQSYMLAPDTLRLADIAYISRAPHARVDTTVIDQLPAPKVGDYYYSDGTWSDGGLVSIDAHGLNPVWADVKPAPLPDKEVIGIVFQTDSTRMSAYDREMGYTHGYVVACRSAHGTHYGNLTQFELQDGLAQDYLPAKRLASSLYSYLEGNLDTQVIVHVFAPDNITALPLFDWVTTDFPFQAPQSSSGWFVPAAGQLWDMMANLCGGEVAAAMVDWQTLNYDATYYCSVNVSYDVIAAFNSHFALIPDDRREDLTADSQYWNQEGYTGIFCTSPYDDEACVVFNIGNQGHAEWMAAWAVGEYKNARPILAF